MPYSDFRVDFYVTSTANDVEDVAVAEYFEEIAAEESNASTPLIVGENGYFIMGLHEMEYEREYAGAFAKLRKGNLPRIGNELGEEEDIALLEGQGLIEKNFFIYESARNLLAWQLNTNASHIGRFENYLSDKMPNGTKISPVVESDALARLMQGQVMLSTLDISFALPSNPDMFPTDVNSQRLLELMNGLNAESIKIHVSANAPGRGVRQQLRAQSKRMLQGDCERCRGSEQYVQKRMEPVNTST